MKKLWFILITVLVTACNTSTCILGQIPPQFVYAGLNCTAPLPDYTKMVTVTGGCTGFTVTQFPLPANFVFSVTQQKTHVIITAKGTNNKTSQISFDVNLLDTITPVIQVHPDLATISYEVINHLYDVAERAVIYKMQEFDVTFPYESLGIPRSFTDSTYWHRQLAVYTTPGFALTGKGGGRVWSWK